MDGYVEADAVGHRVVHGGARFVRTRLLVTDEVEAAIEELSPLAPLHNEPALAAIRRARPALPDVPHVAVFDTAFHSTIPYGARTYASRRGGARSGEFDATASTGSRCSESPSRSGGAVGRLPPRRRLLGHGGAPRPLGRHDDGLQPARGRADGDALGLGRPGALLYVQREHGLSVDELDHALEQESGLAWRSGGLDDSPASPSSPIAWPGRGAMAMALGGLDLLAFSGGVGENRRIAAAVAARRLPRRLRRARSCRPREELVIAEAAETLLADQWPSADACATNRIEPGLDDLYRASASQMVPFWVHLSGQDARCTAVRTRSGLLRGLDRVAPVEGRARPGFQRQERFAGLVVASSGHNQVEVEYAPGALVTAG